MTHNKFLVTILVAMFSLSVFVEPASAATSQSTNYSAIVVQNSGSNIASSTSYQLEGVLGQPMVDLVSGEETEAYFGMILPITLELPIGEFEIVDIRAFSLLSRLEVLEVTWQKDSDLYFTWEIEPFMPPGLIQGYSVSLDEDPDETIDTTMEYYDGFALDGITEGSHVFYVKAATSGDIWSSVVSFEFWVDNREPSASRFTPAPGTLINNNTPTISFAIRDAHSGLNIESINLYINNSSVNATYEDGLVTYEPLSPLSDGSKNIRIQAEDLVGNILSQVWGFSIDASGPQGSIVINGGDESTNFSRVRINVTAEDAMSQVAQMVLSNDGVFDSERWEDFFSIRTDWILDEPQKTGAKTVYCKFRDEAGNESAIYRDEITLLSAVIDTIITSGPYSPTKEISAEFSYQSSFENAAFSYKLDDQDWSSWSEEVSVSLSGLGLGNHVFSVKSAKDLNEDFIITEEEEDSIPAQWTWVIKSEEEEVEEEEKVLLWRTE
ncbi:hypothetical protein ACFL2J_02805 [Candidatus Omnitrophota bacterium]